MLRGARQELNFGLVCLGRVSLLYGTALIIPKGLILPGTSQVTVNRWSIRLPHLDRGFQFC